MVFNWVWKNVLGGEEDAADFNENEARPKGINNLTNETGASSATIEKSVNEINGVVDGMHEGSLKRNNNKAEKLNATATTDVNSKTGGNSLPMSRNRKNKMIATESTTAKKIRISGQHEDGKLASTTTSSSEQVLVSFRPSYQFDEMYAKLAAYKEEKGHCRVPQNYKDDRKLAAWVKNIRRNQKPGKAYDEKQIERLNAIGFQWESKAGRPVGATIEAGAKSPARKFRKPIEDDED